MHNNLELIQNLQTSTINVKKKKRYNIFHVKHYFWQKPMLKASYNNLSVL